VGNTQGLKTKKLTVKIDLACQGRNANQRRRTDAKQRRHGLVEELRVDIRCVLYVRKRHTKEDPRYFHLKHNCPTCLLKNNDIPAGSFRGGDLLACNQSTMKKTQTTHARHPQRACKGRPAYNLFLMKQDTDQ
jgi:hypothetical protein